MKKFTFNKVFILRSLAPKDKKLWEPGNALYDALRKEKVPCQLIDIQEGFNQFGKEIMQIVEECMKEGVRPIIHFICHGIEPNKYPQYPNSAMVLWNEKTQQNEIVRWEYVMYLLEYINEASHFNLFVTMSVCHGFYSLTKLLDEHYRIPFCGALASPDAIYVVSSMEYYKDFYIALIHNKNVYEAQQKLLECLYQYKDMYEANGWKIEEQLVFFADQEFTKAAKADYKMNRSTEEQLRATAVKAYHDVGHLNPTEDEIEIFVKMHPTFFWEEFTKVRDYKFMLDDYPDNRDILELPYSFEELIN